MNNRTQTQIDAELLLDFFLVFSRAEYALKNAGFLKGDERRVDPDWDAFAASIKNQFLKDKSKELEVAVKYILYNPPMKQVLRQNSLMWEANTPNAGLTETEKLLLLVRRVRNNLFHGGKHNVGLFENTERSTQLLTSSIIVIRECILLSPGVEAVYKGAVI
ncbi:MAG: hypothetical protein AB7Y74_04950 [Syntrophorhabdus sp.]